MENNSGNQPEQENQQRRGISWPVALLLAVILVVLSSGTTYYVLAQGWLMQGPSVVQRNQVEKEIINSASFNRLVTVISLANKYSKYKPTVHQMVEGSIQGALDSLNDKYATYYDPQAWKNFNIESNGNYTGVGISVSQTKVKGKEYVTVMTVFPGSPAANVKASNQPAAVKPGLQPGDRITTIDGHDVVGKPLQTAANLMRGPAGSKVKVTVQRKGVSQPLTFDITRKKISVPTVNGKIIKGNIGYVQITMFSGNTPGQLKSTIGKLQKQGAKGLIIDLRNNPGGRLDAVRDCLNLFIPGGPVVQFNSRTQHEVLSVDKSTIGMPFDVLVNQWSASASEIFSGAVQDYKVAPVIGVTTYGKGTVQNVFKLSNDKAGVKFTIAEYLTGKGRHVDGKGITPDIKVTMPKDGVIGQLDKDPQLQKAVSVLQQRMQGQ